MQSSEVPTTVSEAWLSTLADLIAVRSPLSEALYQRLVARNDWNPDQRIRLLTLAPWMAPSGATGTVPTVADNELVFGVMGYKTPDKSQTSRDIGDWVQTVSMLSHVIRRPDVQFTGPDTIVDALSRMRALTPKANLIGGPAATLRLVEFNRDATLYDRLPPDTWAFVFGWFMKNIYGSRPQFPLSENIHPVFLSFHISHTSFLKPAVVEYLKQHEPIGCRDWHTVRALRSRGVSAYLSGCVTTTIGGLYPSAVPDSSKPLAYVDVKPPEGTTNVVELKNLDDALRTRELGRALTQAYDRINAYRSEYSGVVTGRLHAYLPAESCGVPVTWRPSDPDDRRFDGLIGKNETPRTLMRERLSAIIRVIMDAILSGATPEEVRRVHSTETVVELAQAEQKLSTTTAPAKS